MAENETAASNDSFSYNNKPHHLSWYSTMKMFYSAKNIIRQFLLSLNFLGNAKLFFEAHSRRRPEEVEGKTAHSKRLDWTFRAKALFLKVNMKVVSNFSLTWNFSKVQRRALYIEFWRLAREEKISQISLKESVGGSESNVPCAQVPSTPLVLRTVRRTRRWTDGRTTLALSFCFCFLTKKIYTCP